MTMKSHKYGKIAVSLLLLFVLLTMAVSAALPPTMEPQWTNTIMVFCTLDMGTPTSYADISVEAKTGSTIEATLTLYCLYDGTASIAAKWEATAKDYLDLSKPFVPMDGASYYLVLNVTVTRGGYPEKITASDTAP